MTIKYYHPSVGTYYERKGIQLRASDLAIGGAAAGLGLAALPRNSKALAIPAGIGGALLSNLLAPRKILSWYDPPPEGKPTVYPPDIPDMIVPSYIDDDGIVLDWLMYNGEGQQIRDYSKYGNHGILEQPAEWIAGPQGWAIAFDGAPRGTQVATLPPIVFPNGSEWSWEGWLNCTPGTSHLSLFSNAGQHPLFSISYQLKSIFFLSDNYGEGTPYVGIGVFLQPQRWYQFGLNSRPGRVDFVLNGQMLGYNGRLPEGHNGMIFSQFGSHWHYHLRGLVGIQRVYARTLSPQEWGEHFESTRGIFKI